MVLKEFLTEKPPTASTTVLGMIFNTGWRNCKQEASFVTFVGTVVQRVTRVTHIFLCNCSLNFREFPLNIPLSGLSIKENNFVVRKVLLKLFKFFKTSAIG